MRLILGCIIVLLFSCKQANVNVVGMTLSAIEGQKLQFKEGASLSLTKNIEDKIIYLFRHAEKETAPKGGNPNLSETGKSRAQRLAILLKDADVDIVYSTKFNRTLQTIEPLARATQVETKIYQPEEMSIFVPELLKKKEQTIIICGHSNTTPAMINKIMGEEKMSTSLANDAYDDFFVIHLKGNGKKEFYPIKFE